MLAELRLIVDVPVSTEVATQTGENPRPN